MRIQLALDGTLTESLMILERVAPYIDIVEVGTPLLLREGVRALQIVHTYFPDLPLVADVKIMDAGELEATIAFKVGARIVTVMGFAADATIAGAVTAAQQYSREVMVDLMQIAQPARRIADCQAMGCDYFCVHTAHDTRRSQSPVDLLRALRFAVPDAALAVAGGINLATIDAISVAQPEIVVIGSAITRADNPVDVARSLSDRIKAYA
ncbi:MAG: orotidine 5'-phosphate decarboxylase [Anaerolineae bacterium]|nr:orotidine 5'-phosphate decarboxylase [Anaerolineae bacterium]